MGERSAMEKRRGRADEWGDLKTPLPSKLTFTDLEKI